MHYLDKICTCADNDMKCYSLVYCCGVLYIGIFDDDFIEDRKKGLEEFINK